MTTTLPAVGRARHVLAEVVAGLVLVVIGGLAAAGAIGLLAAFGTSSRVDSGAQQLSSSSRALVSDVTTVQNTRGVSTLTGRPVLQLTAAAGPGSPAVFIGIGPASAVDRYLRGAAVDEVTDLTVEPFDLTVQRHAGAAAPASPAAQTFWVASGSSPTTADLTWQVQDGDYRLVVMNADGSAGVRPLSQLRLTLPHAFPISLAVLTGAALAVLAGGALLGPRSRSARAAGGEVAVVTRPGAAAPTARSIR
jgi:hypothetical protein